MYFFFQKNFHNFSTVLLKVEIGFLCLNIHFFHAGRKQNSKLDLVYVWNHVFYGGGQKKRRISLNVSQRL